MWIRSQDKEKLLNTNSVFAYDNNIKCIMDKMFFLLGTYSTKEKALKVLDMIQHFINDLEYHKILGLSLCHYVFEMPHDSEVEDDEE